VKGWLGLAIYLAAAVLHPAAHLWHHQAAHAHAVELPNVSADLVALGLEDVGAPAVVDCSLASLTMVDCEMPSHGTRRFGDDLDQTPRAPAFDPRHGEGRPEHLGVSVLAEQRFILPAPLVHDTRVPEFPLPTPSALAIALTHDSRGPPASA
jgi:hypothetical protein